jgi:hypothetical protein
LLRDLAERIRGASIWNYENNEIPEVFEIHYRVNADYKIEQDFTINGEGKIVKKMFWEIDPEFGGKLYYKSSCKNYNCRQTFQSANKRINGQV